jgi:stringent starvation protein B
MNRTNEHNLPSTRPYLIRAMHEWCTDHGFSPYLAVRVDRSVQVPPEYVRNGEIVLNISHDATSGLRIGNEWIEFKARFGGVARDVVVPVSHVVAIYARENGQGLAFPPPEALDAAMPGDESAAATPDSAPDEEPAGHPLRAVPPEAAAAADDVDAPPPPAAPKGGRPVLKRVK